MTETTTVPALAQELAAAFSERHVIAPPSSRGDSFDLATAYAIESDLVRMRRAAGQKIAGVLCAAIIAVTSPLAAQDQKAATNVRLSFEVASIKQNRSGTTGWSFGAQPGGRWRMVNRSVATLIREAYPAQVPELLGAPAWVTSDPYDVIAKGEGDPTREQIRMMLQTLLAERFKLEVHVETQERPVFALVSARSDGRPSPGLARSPLDCDAVNAARRAGRRVDVPLPANGAPPCGMSLQAVEAQTLLFGGLPLSRLAEWLGPPSGRVVVDKTGLTDNYEFTLRYTSQLSPRDDAPSVFTALEEQLGLKLVPDRAPLTVLVIDRIDRPTED